MLQAPGILNIATEKTQDRKKTGQESPMNVRSGMIDNGHLARETTKVVPSGRIDSSQTAQDTPKVVPSGKIDSGQTDHGTQENVRDRKDRTADRK